MSLKKTILLGSGGHASVLFEVFYLLNEKLAGIVDKRADVSFRDCPYLGDDTYLESIKSSDFSLVNGIGRNGHPNRRADIFEDFKRKDFHFLSVIHPSVIQANDVCLGEGVQLLAGVIIQPKVHIEKNVIVNTGALIEHDTQIAEHVFIGPKATICGGVKIEPHAFIGAGAVILPGVTIGANAVIGAGAVVLEDIPENHLAVGNPAFLKGVYSHDALEKCAGAV